MKVVVTDGGEVGAGRLTIKGGTLTVPPIVIKPGEKTTEAKAGAIEYDGRDIWVTTETLSRNRLVNTELEQRIKNKELRLITKKQLRF